MKKLDALNNELISVSGLLLLGYRKYNDLSKEYIPPYPANGGTYRLEYKATRFKSHEPVKGTEEWRAYLPGHKDVPTIRRFKTLGELNDFHKGMCGKYLF